MRRQLALLIPLLAWATLTACDGGKPDREPFVFTPVPYTTILDLHGTPAHFLSADLPEWHVYADQILVVFDAAQEEELRAALDELGFGLRLPPDLLLPPGYEPTPDPTVLATVLVPQDP